jgi:hypothetical protein
VYPEEHKRLLEEIIDAAPIHSEPKEAQPHINRSAAYFSAQQRARSEANPLGRVYGPERRDEFILEMVEAVAQDHRAKAESGVNAVLAISGLQNGWKKIERDMACRRNETTQVDVYRHSLLMRKDDIPYFDERIDFALYQREHPLDSIEVSEEELGDYYQAMGHRAMVNLAWLLPKLKLRPFRAGLKKALAE